MGSKRGHDWGSFFLSHVTFGQSPVNLNFSVLICKASSFLIVGMFEGEKTEGDDVCEILCKVLC